MNKNLHRLVFNEARGQMMPVAEIAVGVGKGASDEQSGASTLLATVRRLPMALWVALGMVTMVTAAQAQIIADRSAPRNQQPTILVAPSGAPLVNIQTPSAAGVSRNTYSQFDVQQQGAVLNNSRTGAQTQVGGAVGPNPWLARGTARVILNEVNSTDPSKLKGYVEVAGDKAQVVIANPAGITCDGCGFINASRATVTTGTPVVSGGHLDGYRVERGTVSVEGRGMDARGADYTDIIARAVKVNGEVVGKEIKVRQGAALVKADNSGATAIQGSGDKPLVGIDVAQLGGMYANKIVLIGSEAGVGVRNAGNLGASAGEVAITADGQLVNIGKITASAQVAIDAGAGIDNSGTIFAGTDNRLKTRGNVANSGTGLIASAQHTTIEATGADSRIVVGEQATVAAGLKTTGEGEQAKTEISGTGDLLLQATGGTEVRGTLAAAGDLRISAKTLDLGQARLSGQNLFLAAVGGGFDARAATVLSSQSLIVRSAQGLTTDGATLDAGLLDVQAQSWSNREGRVLQTGSGIAQAQIQGTFDNEGGALVSFGSLELRAGTVDNTGGSILTSQDSATGASPKAAGSGNLRLQAASLQNTGGTINAIRGDTQVDIGGPLTNGKDGYIGADGRLSIASAGLTNVGTLRGNGIILDARGQALSNAGGNIVSDGDVITHSRGFDNEGGLVVGERLSLDAQGMGLSNRQVDASHGLVGKTGIALEVGAFDNSGGYVFVGDEGLRVNGRSVKNSESGTIEGTGALTVSGGDFDNRGGNISLVGAVDVSVGNGKIDNTGGLIGSGGHVELRAGQVVNSDTLDQIAAAQANAAEAKQAAAQLGIQGQSVQITAASVANDNGAILANESVTINGSGQLNNTLGTISAGRALRILDSTSNSLDANRLVVVNTGGTLIANEALQVNVGRITADGKLHSNGDFDLRLNSSMTNAGELTAGGNLSITTTGNFVNSGVLSAANALSVSAAGNLNNTATGEITAMSTLLSAGGQLTNRGLINGDDTVLKGETIANIGTGRIYGTHIAIEAGTLYNTDESRSASRQVGFVFKPWNQSWYVASQEDAGALDGSGKSGVIAARERLDLGVKELRNFNGAEIVSEGDIHFGGGLDANSQAAGRTSKVTNSSALIEAGGDIDWAHVDKVLNTRTQLVLKTDSVTTHEQALLFDTGGAGLYRAVKDIQTTVNTTTLDDKNSTAAGVIRSGGAMDFRSTNLRNEASGIYAFGGVQYDPDHYQVRATKTVETLVSGTMISFLRDGCHGWESCTFKHNRMETTAIGVDRPRTVSEDAPDTELKGSEIKVGDATLYDRSAQKAPDFSLPAGTRSQAVQGSQAGSGTQVAGAVDANAPKTIEVRTGNINLQVPASSLFNTSTDPQARTLVTTDAKFAGYRQWLDSDYLLRELGVDPGSVGRRLGDGYYEQRLIRDQTAQLLGARLLDKNVNNESEYIALMTNAIDYAKKNNLKIGIALTAEQAANLPNDIVWLEYRDVTLSNGGKLQALVPQVYSRAKLQQKAAPGQLGNGVIAANRIDYTVNGDFTNTNTLTARDALAIRADSIRNVGGLLQAGSVALTAKTDIQGTGGQVLGTDSVLLSAGRDIDLATTMRTRGLGNATFQQTDSQIDQLSSVTVTGTGGALALDAGRNLTLTGAQVQNTGSGGQTALTAKGDILLDSIVTRTDLQYAPNAGNFGQSLQVQDVGSLVAGTGDVWLKADGNLTSRAAVVSSSAGVTSLQAGQDLNLMAGRSEHLDDIGRTHSREGILNKVTTITRDTVDQVASVGTTVAGQDVQLKAGRDINLQATQVTAAKLLDVAAGRDLNVLADQASRSEAHDWSQSRRANDFGKFNGDAINASGGFDIGYAVMQKSAKDRLADQQQTVAASSVLTAGTLQMHSSRDTTLQAATLVADENLTVDAGRNLSLVPVEQQKQDATTSGSHTIGQIGSWYQPSMGAVKQTQDNAGSSTTLASTQVMSLHGDVSLQAGEQYLQTASQVAAPEGNIQIAAQQVTINEGIEKGESSQDGKYAKAAIGGTISIPLVSAVQSIHGMVKAGEDTKDDRMKAMAAFNTVMAAKDAAGAVTDMMGGGLGGIKVSVNISYNESKNSFEQSGTNAVGSLVAAGGNVDIHATGAGQDSNLLVSGSQIDAGQDVTLKADNTVTLKAAENTAHQHGKNSSAGVSIGVGFALGGSQNGFTIDLSASASRGKANGDDLSYTNTHVTAGNSFRIDSGGDTTLSGAVVKASQIGGDVKGNLKVQSLQDSSTYQSLQESAGLAISLCIPPICEGMSTVGASFSHSAIDSNFLAVTEQTGFKAGDGGYQLKVGGDTHLIGGVIASSDKAIAEGKNSFEHGGSVQMEDINNRVEFKGSSMAVSGSVGSKLGDQSNPGNFGNQVAEWAKPGGTWDPDAGRNGDTATASKGGSTASSNGKGNTTVVGPSGRQPSASFGTGSDSGMALSVTSSGIGVSTNADTAGIIAPIFDLSKVQRELGAQTRITQTFSQVAPKAVADLAESRMRPMEDAAAYKLLQEKQDEGKSLSAQEQATWKQLQARGVTGESADQLLNDPQMREDYARWNEGGAYRVALHTVVGVLGGGVNGGIGAGTVATAAPALENVQQRLTVALVNVGFNNEAADVMAHGVAQLTSAGLGAAVGGAQGAGYGWAVDTNNRMLGPRDRKVAQLLAAKSQGRYSQADVESALRYSGLRDANGKQTMAEGSREWFTGDGPATWVNQLSFPGFSWEQLLSSDPNIQLRPAQDGRTLIEDVPTTPSRDLATFILANTGSKGAPYTFSNVPYLGNPNELPEAPTGTYRANVSVDGVGYSPLMANCPAVSCTNGDPIAKAVPDSGTVAYQVAVERKIEKDLNLASAFYGIGGSLMRAGFLLQDLAVATNTSVGLSKLSTISTSDLIVGDGDLWASYGKLGQTEISSIKVQPLPQIRVNAENGAAFQSRAEDFMADNYGNVRREVSIKPFTDTSGSVAPFRVRLDAIGAEADGSTIGLMDAKASARAPFTPNQTTGYPLLSQFGGVIAGKNGLPYYPAGTIIPPTPVIIIRPTDLPKGY